MQARTIERRPVTDRRPQRTRIPLLWRWFGAGAILRRLDEIERLIVSPADKAALEQSLASLQETDVKIDDIEKED